jgi:hypothetical protein
VELVPGAGDLLDATVAHVRRYVVLTPDQLVAVALWNGQGAVAILTLLAARARP